MSYFQRDITFYPNYLFYHSSQKEYARNFNPSAEPSVSGATYTNSDSTTSGPAFDMVDNKRSTVCAIASAAGNVTIDFDISSSFSCDSVLIDNHTLNDGLGANVYVQQASSTQTMNSAYQSNGYNVDQDGGWDMDSQTVTTNIVSPDANGLLLMEFDSFTASDVQVIFTPRTAGVPAVDVGEIALCKSWTAPHAPNIEGWEDSVSFPTTIINTPGGQLYGLGNYGSRRGWNLSWSHISQADKDALFLLYRVTHGGKYPMYFDLGENATRYIYYGRFAENSFRARPMAGGTVWNVSFGLITDV